MIAGIDRPIPALSALRKQCTRTERISLRSLRAVSGSVRRTTGRGCIISGGRSRYSDLKEAAPRSSLWGLFVDQPVLIVCEVAVAVGALRFQLVIAGRMVAGRRIGEAESHNNTAFEE